MSLLRRYCFAQVYLTLAICLVASPKKIFVEAASNLRTNSLETGRTIPPTLFGVNLVYSWESDAYWSYGGGDSSSVLYYTTDAFWRYPGGEVTSFTHVLNATGRGWTDSWNPNFNGVFAPSQDWMGIDEYASLIKSAPHAASMLGVNARSGWKYNRTNDGLDEARTLAELVNNEMDWTVDYWFIDNEQYTEWNATTYAGYIKQYADEIRDILPAAKFVANWKNGNADSWDDLLASAGNNIHVMDIHSYWHKNGWGTTTWDSYLSGVNTIIKWQGSTYRQYVNRFKDKAAEYGLNDMQVGILEWGVSPSPSPEETMSRFQTAFMVADIFMQLIDSELDHACYWPFRVPGPVDGVPNENSHRAMVDDNNEPTVVRLFLQFFKDIKNYQLISSSINAVKTDALAAISNSGNKIVVYILRKTGGDLDIRLSDTGSFRPETASAISYSAPSGITESDTAHWSSPETVIDGSGKTHVTILGWSLTKVILEKFAGPPPPPPTPTSSPAPTVACGSVGESCANGGECCSGKCKGKSGSKTCKA